MNESELKKEKTEKITIAIETRLLTLMKHEAHTRGIPMRKLVDYCVRKFFEEKKK